MGYETRLIVGKACHTSDELKTGGLIVDGSEEYAYRPYLKDNEGELIKTGRKETYFMVYAVIELCKCGHESAISKIDFKNTDESHYWYWYGIDGNTQIVEDCYGEKSKPIPIKTVIDALEADVTNDDYRRFKWALGSLLAMKDDPEEIEVLFYGH